MNDVVVKLRALSIGENSSPFMRKTVAEAADVIDGALKEISKHLDPNNENVRRGDLVASIRDLAQIAVSSLDTARELEARIAILSGCMDGD